jgi:hypothetical protein
MAYGCNEFKTGVWEQWSSWQIWAKNVKILWLHFHGVFIFTSFLTWFWLTIQTFSFSINVLNSDDWWNMVYKSSDKNRTGTYYLSNKNVKTLLPNYKLHYTSPFWSNKWMLEKHTWKVISIIGVIQREDRNLEEL